MVHDFKKFPELTNNQMQIYYFESPHKQIVEDFRGEVVRVTDGDTITLRVDFRDFDFPLRFLDTNAPELNEDGGLESKEWLAQQIEGKEVEVKMNRKNRVGRFGRLLGKILFRGVDMNDESIRTGHALPFERRKEGQLPDLNKELNLSKWF